MYFTSTPKPVKGSENVSSKTVFRRSKFLMGQLNNTCGNTEKLLKSFEEDHRKNILMKAGIVAADMAPEEMVAMRVDMGILWEKVKYMAR